ncbi:ribonuclease HII [Candidatus Pacearchaeota archaeon]|nr:ribonuclease HII [Candidatus Pacearchaeota archaeon]|tara:strand:- start:71 stop:775 length:705 start_codon:yes stop_codon:yes gene_type:complete
MDKKENGEENNCDLILGLDDAGRGPIIGAMALAGCLITKEVEKYLKDLGVKDSKLLTPKKREEIVEKIRKGVSNYTVILTHPNEIDEKINTGTNLNKIEAIKAAHIINKLTRGIKEKIKVIIDCPSPNREAWKKDVLENIENPDNLLIFCEHKADSRFISVAAASILAKSEREKDVSKIKERINKDFGSGYPSDPQTKKFVEKNWNKYPEIFRKTWSTYKNAAKAATEKQKKLF